MIIIEDLSYEHMTQPTKRASKKDQAKRYCGQTRTEESQNTQSLQVVVTVGKASQFFEYTYGQSVSLNEDNWNRIQSFTFHLEND